jgi:ribosome-associated protein
VQLRFNLGASSLPSDMKDRIRQLATNRITADDILVIDSREHRTQARNREAARARLQALVAQASRKPKRRKATKPRPESREKRLQSKKKRGTVKVMRGRVVEE